MNRDFCPRCAIKHLAQARILLLERDKGYPHHVWYAQGHMAEAEDEIIERMPDEANMIREQRVALDKDPRAKIDFKTLLYKVATVGMLPELMDDEETKRD